MKGISPIVAAVLLIAITMAIAGILSFWAGSFVQKNIKENENTIEIDCINAKFRIYSTCSYIPQSKEIKFILENQRNIELNLTSLYVFYPNNLLTQIPISLRLPGNQLIPFNISNIDPGFESFQIRSNCPDLYIQFNCT